MTSADDIKRLFRNAELRTHPDTHEKVFQDVLGARQQAIADAPARPERWRIAMREPIVKYAVAAAFILAAMVGVSMFLRTGHSAWAIEESIEALDKYRAIYLEGFISDFDEQGAPQQRSLKSWDMADEEQRKVEKERIEIDGVAVLVVNGRTTWRYDPRTNTVIKNRPYGTPECWCGSRFLEQLREYHDSGMLTSYEVTYGKDPTTGRQKVFLSCAWLDERYNGPRSLWLEFDGQSKLLTGLKQWENARWEGPARLVGEKVTYYESLPDDLFEFQIPEGATVIEE